MIAVSFLKSKYDREKTIKLIDQSEADLIHVDLMDGEYVPNRNFTIEEIMSLLRLVTKPLDIHLMVKNPFQYIKELVKLNVYMITVHLDATPNMIRTTYFLKEHNIKFGLALNPLEDVHTIDQWLTTIDYVLIMGVTPGAGGQQFMPEVLKKIDYFKDRNVMLGIDGGINAETVKYLKDYHFDIVVSGSYICMSDDYNEAIKQLKKYCD